MDDQLRKARDNWVRALFKAGYDLLDEHWAAVRVHLNISEDAEFELMEQATEAVLNNQPVLRDSLLAEYIYTDAAVEDFYLSRRGFKSGQIVDLADKIQGDFLEEYGD